MPACFLCPSVSTGLKKNQLHFIIGNSDVINMEMRLNLVASGVNVKFGHKFVVGTNHFINEL